MAPRQRLSPTNTFDDEIHQRPLSRNADLPTAPIASAKELAEVQASKHSEADFAREKHDFFNLIALLFVVASTALDWDLSLLMKGYGPNTAWRGEYFYVNWATTVCYFLLDLIWVAQVPICVKSPGVIIKHHIVAIAYLSGPIIWPEFRWFMGACLSVEINTWFLILRRVVFKRKEQLPDWLATVVEPCFYATWVAVRIFIYPAILFEFLRLAVERVTETRIYWHWEMVMIAVHAILCCLNLKWSYDLFVPIIRTSLGIDKKSGKVANGL